MDDELGARVGVLIDICKQKRILKSSMDRIILPVREGRVYGIPATLVDPKREGKECTASQDRKTIYMTFNIQILQARLEELLYAKATD